MAEIENGKNLEGQTFEIVNRNDLTSKEKDEINAKQNIRDTAKLISQEEIENKFKIEFDSLSNALSKESKEKNSDSQFPES